MRKTAFLVGNTWIYTDLPYDKSKVSMAKVEIKAPIGDQEVRIQIDQLGAIQSYERPK